MKDIKKINKSIDWYLDNYSQILLSIPVINLCNKYNLTEGKAMALIFKRMKMYKDFKINTYIEQFKR